ncbi:hypothetical protein [Cysteiniphilum sp. JM-1]|uniref:hypothetical protein n=1 Tax=Cysteiniphilum sp. JM-1 TaxID=2610891 RepID=UPI0012474297|nr:hypothetical protein [Cysteiniphilum sp. JM-1]
MFKFKRTKKLLQNAFMIDAIKQQHNVLKRLLILPFIALTRVSQQSVDKEKINKTLTDEILYNQCLTALKYRFYFFLILFSGGVGYFGYLVIETHAVWQATLMMLMLNVILFLYVFRYHMWLTQAKHKLKHLSLAGYFKILSVRLTADKKQQQSLAEDDDYQHLAKNKGNNKSKKAKGS